MLCEPVPFRKKEAPREEVHEPQQAAETEPENGNKLDQRVKSPIQEHPLRGHHADLNTPLTTHQLASYELLATS